MLKYFFNLILTDATTAHFILFFSKVIGVKESSFTEAITHRLIVANNEKVYSPLTEEQSVYARDALSKAVYGRLFDWLVKQLNKSLTNKVSSVCRSFV